MSVDMRAGLVAMRCFYTFFLFMQKITKNTEIDFLILIFYKKTKKRMTKYICTREFNPHTKTHASGHVRKQHVLGAFVTSSTELVVPCTVASSPLAVDPF